MKNNDQAQNSPIRGQAKSKLISIITILFVICLSPRIDLDLSGSAGENLEFVISTCYASGTGTTGAQFLRLGAGARPVAMGGAYTAVADDVNGPQYNAAGIAWARHKEAMARYIDYLEGLSYSYLG
ncbi:MAG: hypothetical protein HY920_01345 [Elusimicrobia bacterium]|nr:hypothetical protein [Elusimicrobiota bacterium]